MTLGRLGAPGAIALAAWAFALAPGVDAAQRKPAASRAAAKPTPRPAKPTARPKAPAANARPDQALFSSAERAERALRASAAKVKSRAEWDRVVSAFRAVVQKFPRSPYCDDALLAAGRLLDEAGRRFGARKAREDAAAAYDLLVAEYPSSRHGERALYEAWRIRSSLKLREAAGLTAEKYLDAYPAGPHAGEVRAPQERSRRALSQVHAVRFWSGASSTRVVIDLERRVPIQYDRLSNPPRLYVDLKGARLHPNLLQPDRTPKVFPVGDGFLKQIRVAGNSDGVVRVVVDFDDATEHTVFFLPSPERLVIDVKGGRGGSLRASAAAPPAPPPTAPTTPTPPNASSEAERVAVREEAVVLPPSDSPPSSTPAAAERVESPATGAVAPTATPAATPAPAPTPVAATADASPEAPSRNRDGSYSLARQLGLGARRIALDAGHGGHDPGALGRRGTQEKDITLAVVMKLEKLIRRELGADVVLTRDRDVFIPLEERTAIANASGADLFLSVHINSARNPAGRGLETYYLSFAKNAAAEELAARENAISQATMKDLNNLVKAITTNSKIDESRDFAAAIQASIVSGLGPRFRVQNRGVHTAPFYVLIGANMPSILTEVGFISNAEEERWLRSDEYQNRLAESLLVGVRHYLGQLSTDPTTRVAGRAGERVPPTRSQKK